MSELARSLLDDNPSHVGNYRIGRTIGEGSFGKVKAGVHLPTGVPVAIKIVDKTHLPVVVREIESWRYMHHPHIVQLYEVLRTESRIYMVTELCRGGEVFDLVCRHGRLPEAEACRLFSQIVRGVQHCHDNRLVHRDLKLENILLTQDGDVKIIDFGFTKEYNDRTLLDTYCGSVSYAAPEMITGKRYAGPAADVWSLGIILYALLCGYLPFDDDADTEVHAKVLRLEYTLPAHLSPEAADLITRILQLDAAQRLSLAQIQSHPWFQA
ncbi:hypothetical protein CXG81DRAFT_13654, partial [Caulochytrium protostelioides]